MPTMDFDACVAPTLDHIDHSPEIHSTNKRLIREYHRDLLLSGIGAARRQQLITHLKVICDHLGDERFDQLNRDDIERLVEWLYTRGSAPATITDYKQVLKQFYTWLNDGEEPEETSGSDAVLSVFEELQTAPGRVVPIGELEGVSHRQ